jgi:hypothetical protein
VELDGEVRVGVPDDADGKKLGRAEARLLGQLPCGGRLRRLSRFDASSRELPEPTQQPLSGPLPNEPAPLGRERDDRRDDVGSLRARAAAREDSRVGQILASPAVLRDRADRALRPSREADRLAQLHQRLVERRGVVLR